MDSGADILHGTFGGTSVTVTAGATVVAVTDAWKGDEFRETGGPKSLGIVRVSWRFKVADLGAINLSPGHTITHGSDIWKVDEGGVTGYGQGGEITAQTSRPIQRGGA